MVHVQDPRVRWAVPATRVLRIASVASWYGPSPLDVLTGLGPPPHTGVELHRVVVVTGAGGGELSLLAAGPIAIVDVDPADVLALPVQVASATPTISAIIVAPDASLSLLLDPLALALPAAASVRNHA